MGWFRLHDEVMDDPKVDKLPDSLFKSWVKVLCLASKHRGSLPHDLRDVAYALRISEKKARTILDELIKAGLLDEHDDQFLRPHNWDYRQYRDDSKERVKRFRKRECNADVTVDVTGTVTPTDTDYRDRTETEHKNQELLAISLMPDWVPVKAFEQFVEMRRKIRKPMSEPAKLLAIKELEKLRNSGEDPEAVLNQSIFRSYQGLFPVKQEQKDARQTSKAERRNAHISETTDRVFGVSGKTSENIPKSLSARSSS